MQVYYREIDDTTSYSTMYYTPRPGRKEPSFVNDKKEEVIIEGVNRDHLRFYRYKDDTDPWRVNGRCLNRICLY